MRVCFGFVLADFLGPGRGGGRGGQVHVSLPDVLPVGAGVGEVGGVVVSYPHGALCPIHHRPVGEVGRNWL